MGGHDIPAHSGDFSPSISGALGASGAGGAASLSTCSAPRTVHGSHQAASGADGGSLRSPGARGAASPSTHSTLRTAPGSRRAAGGAAGGALGPSGAGGAASPSNLTPCSGPSFPSAPRLGAIHKSKGGLPLDPPLTQQVTPSFGTSSGGARFEGSGGDIEAAPIPPRSGTGGSTSSDVQAARSGGSGSASSGV